jgi:hypothetical protein
MRASFFILFFFGVTTAVAFAACKSGSSNSGGATLGTAAAVPPKLGKIGVSYQGSPGAGGGSYASVGFTDSTQQNMNNNGFPTTSAEGGAAPECTPVQIGPCVVTSCVQGTPPAGGYPQNTAPAGNITIKDDTNGATALFMAQNNGTNGNYQGNGQLTPTIAVGDSITVTAAGGTVPAFTENVTVPAAVVLAQPTCDAGFNCPVSRAAGYSFSWTGGDHGTVVVTLNGFGAACGGPNCPSLQSTAVCKYDVSGHSGVVTTDVLDRFPEPNVTIQYEVEDLAEVVVSDYTIDVSAVAQGSGGFGIALTQ